MYVVVDIPYTKYQHVVKACGIFYAKQHFPTLSSEPFHTFLPVFAGFSGFTLNRAVECPAGIEFDL